MSTTPLKMSYSGKLVGYKKNNNSNQMVIKKMKGDRLKGGGGELSMPKARVVNTSKSSSNTRYPSESSHSKNKYSMAKQPVQYSNQYGKLATEFVC